MIKIEDFLDAVINQTRLLDDKDFQKFIKSFDGADIIVTLIFFSDVIVAFEKQNTSPMKAMMLNAMIFYFIGFHHGRADLKEEQEVQKRAEIH